MRYKTVRLKKRFNGFAEIRSYLFDQIKEAGMGIRFIYGNEIMEIPHDQLGRGFVTARGIQSKINRGQIFDLISFKWKEEEKETDQGTFDFE